MMMNLGHVAKFRENQCRDAGERVLRNKKNFDAKYDRHSLLHRGQP